MCSYVHALLIVPHLHCIPDTRIFTAWWIALQWHEKWSKRHRPQEWRWKFLGDPQGGNGSFLKWGYPQSSSLSRWHFPQKTIHYQVPLRKPPNLTGCGYFRWVFQMHSMFLLVVRLLQATELKPVQAISNKFTWSKLPRGFFRVCTIVLIVLIIPKSSLHFSSFLMFLEMFIIINNEMSTQLLIFPERGTLLGLLRSTTLIVTEDDLRQSRLGFNDCLKQILKNPIC